MTWPAGPRSLLGGCGPARHVDDVEDHHAVEGAVAELLDCIDQSAFKEVDSRRARRRDMAKLCSHPPQLRPIHGIPVFDQERGARICHEVVLAHEARCFSRFRCLDGEGQQLAIGGVEARFGMRSARRMQRTQDAMRRSRKPIAGLCAAQLHRRECTTSGWFHAPLTSRGGLR